MKFFLEIAILSYNRLDELERALGSLIGVARDDVRICIYEDCSPNQSLIQDICNKYTPRLSLNLDFKPAKINLGYDANLLRALSSTSEYVLLLSDDDFIDPDVLDDFVDSLYEDRPDVIISPYKACELYRDGRHYRGDYSIDVLYDSVLFSGLAFKVGKIVLTDDEISFIDRSIYSQVYIVCRAWNANCRYYDKPLIFMGSDGENFFGKSEASTDKKTLRDRDSLMSNLYYQEYFQRVVFNCLEKFYPLLIESFLRNYSKRLVSHFMRVRLNGSFFDYLKSVFEIRKIDVRFSLRYFIFVFLVALTPKFLLGPVHKLLISKFRVSGG